MAKLKDGINDVIIAEVTMNTVLSPFMTQSTQYRDSSRVNATAIWVCPRITTNMHAMSGFYTYLCCSQL